MQKGCLATPAFILDAKRIESGPPGVKMLFDELQQGEAHVGRGRQQSPDFNACRQLLLDPCAIAIGEVGEKQSRFSTLCETSVKNSTAHDIPKTDAVRQRKQELLHLASAVPGCRSFQRAIPVIEA